MAVEIERWVAAHLSADERWSLQGRWFDGVVFAECLDQEDEGVSLLGWIWRIDNQTRFRFRVRLVLSADGLASFDLRVAEEDRAQAGRAGKRARDPALAMANSEPDWRFHFVRNA